VKDSRDTNADEAKSVLHDLKITGETLRAARSKKDVIDFTIRIFRKLGFDRVRVWLIDEDRKIYYGAKASYLPDAEFQKAQTSLDGKVLPNDYVSYLKKKKPYRNTTMPLLKKFFGDFNSNYTVGFPMLAGKKLLGVVSVDNLFSGRKIDLEGSETKIMPFVNHIALVLNRVITDEKIKAVNRELKNKIDEATKKLKTKNEILEKLAHYDQLTSLPNRRFLQKFLSERLHRKNKSFIYAMLDIDFLKHVNDTRGHNAGDQLLVKLGAILKKDQDIEFAARFAGDEFAFLLRNLSRAKRDQALQRILRKIKKTTGHTASIGCISLPHPEVASLTDLMRLADDALYHAKHTGRNRFVCAGEKNEQIHSFAERKLNLQKIEEQGTFALDYIRQLAAINKISEILRTAKNEQQIFHKIVSTFRSELAFRRVLIFARNGNHELKIVAHSQKFEKELAAEILDLTKALNLPHQIEQVGRARRIITIDTQKKMFTELQKFKIGNALLIPLIGRKHILGMIFAEHDQQKKFRKSDFDFFLTLGDQIENGVAKARAGAEIESFNRKLKKEVDAATTQLKKYSNSLEEKVHDNQELREKEQRAHFELISALVTSIEEKDIYTRGHSVRVASYAVKLGRALGLKKKTLTNLRYAGLLHDVGKVAVDQSILQKRTALSESETRELENHPNIGAKIVSSAKFLEAATAAIREHHERWDGSGYPSGIIGKKILLEARIIAIADAYDAMITRRSYGRKMNRLEAIRELEIGSGKQFDPELAKIFIQLLKSGHMRKPKSKFSKI